MMSDAYRRRRLAMAHETEDQRRARLARINREIDREAYGPPRDSDNPMTDPQRRALWDRLRGTEDRPGVYLQFCTRCGLRCHVGEKDRHRREYVCGECWILLDMDLLEAGVISEGRPLVPQHDAHEAGIVEEFDGSAIEDPVKRAKAERAFLRSGINLAPSRAYDKTRTRYGGE